MYLVLISGLTANCNPG